MNQLEDPDLIEALCEASTAGVQVDLIIRGFCCLLPGIPGRTSNIRVRSIIGRFLEHSRIFHFANGEEEPVDGDFLIGSADWMVRNLSKRVEVVTPVLDRRAKERLWETLDICLRDQRQAWVLGSDGAYTQLRAVDRGYEGPELVGTHKTLMNIALHRSERLDQRGRIRARNSSRVSLLVRKAPSIALVTVPECCFSTPRIIMQKCRASATTPTPIGSSIS